MSVCFCGCRRVPDYGACTTFVAGRNGRCVYCDHGKQCHPGKGPLDNGRPYAADLQQECRTSAALREQLREAQARAARLHEDLQAVGQANDSLGNALDDCRRALKSCEAALWNACEYIAETRRLAVPRDDEGEPDPAYRGIWGHSGLEFKPEYWRRRFLHGDENNGHADTTAGLEEAE